MGGVRFSEGNFLVIFGRLAVLPTVTWFVIEFSKMAPDWFGNRKPKKSTKFGRFHVEKLRLFRFVSLSMGVVFTRMKKAEEVVTLAW